MFYLVTAPQATLMATTVYGALRGLETFSQLVTANSSFRFTLSFLLQFVFFLFNSLLITKLYIKWLNDLRCPVNHQRRTTVHAQRSFDRYFVSFISYFFFVDTFSISPLFLLVSSLILLLTSVNRHLSPLPQRHHDHEGH